MLGPEPGTGLLQLGFDIHGAEAAQRTKAAVHLCHQAACTGALGHGLRP